MRRVLTVLTIAGCLVASGAIAVQAQSGWTIFSGVKRENELSYRLDYGGSPNSWDRYRLRVSKDKMKLAVSQFTIDYPNYYKGTFDPKAIEISVNDKTVPLQEVKWDKDGSVLEIIPKEPIPAGSNVELILSNVKNPSNGGMFYFVCSVVSPGDIPLPRTLGTWIVSIQ
jgi:hypothetical protein